MTTETPFNQSYTIIEVRQGKHNEIRLLQNKQTGEYSVQDYSEFYDYGTLAQALEVFDRISKVPNYATLNDLVGLSFANEARLERAIKSFINIKEMVPVLDGFYIKHASGEMKKITTSTTIGHLTVLAV